MISFTVYGIPVPKGRPRFFRRGKFIGTYTDKKTSQGEYDFKSQAIKHRPNEPLTGALRIEIHIYVKIPKSFSRTKRVVADHGLIKPITRPDLDNYIKLVLDSMNGIFFIDDAQIVYMKCTKNYSISPRMNILLQQSEAKE